MADFNAAVDKAFEDLTPYLQGDKVKPYPLLANLPTAAWQWSVWNGKLMAVPFPTEPYPSALLYRKDMFDKNGWPLPKTADELYRLGKEITDPKAKRWAFGDIHEMVWPIFGVPQEWRYEGGKLVHKYETPEFELMLEFMRKLFEEGLVHPNVVGSKGANEKDLIGAGPDPRSTATGSAAGRMLASSTPARTPTSRSAPCRCSPHDGGTPIMYHNTAAGIFTFIKKGLRKEKVEEILSILNLMRRAVRHQGVRARQLRRGGQALHPRRERRPGGDRPRPQGGRHTYGFLGGRARWSRGLAPTPRRSQA